MLFLRSSHGPGWGQGVGRFRSVHVQTSTGDQCKHGHQGWQRHQRVQPLRLLQHKHASGAPERYEPFMDIQRAHRRRVHERGGKTKVSQKRFTIVM